MKHDYSILISLQDYVRKDGTRQIMLHGNINRCRPVAKIPLKIYCKTSDFCRKKRLVKNGEYQNAIIENAKIKALGIFKNARLTDIALTKETFVEQYNGFDNNQDFVKWWIGAIRKEGRKMSDGTVKAYMKTYNLFTEYCDKVSFTHLNEKFVLNFDKWIRQQKSKTGKTKGKYFAHNTIVAHYTRLSKFYDIAIDELSLPYKNPFKKFKGKYIEGHKEFLTPTEIQKFVKLYELRKELDLPFHLEESLRMFLFMVGSGLRISDTGNLTGLNIQNDMINIRVQKTKRYKLQESFPLSRFSKRYLKDTKHRIFRYKECQTLNKNLKTICKYLNIDKKITSHCARVTFATTFTLAGGRVEVLQQLLGHKHIDTTMIYVKITKQMERKELDILDSFLDFDGILQA